MITLTMLLLLRLLLCRLLSSSLFLFSSLAFFNYCQNVCAERKKVAFFQSEGEKTKAEENKKRETTTMYKHVYVYISTVREKVIW